MVVLNLAHVESRHWQLLLVVLLSGHGEGLDWLVLCVAHASRGALQELHVGEVADVVLEVGLFATHVGLLALGALFRVEALIVLTDEVVLALLHVEVGALAGHIAAVGGLALFGFLVRNSHDVE